MFDKPEKLGGDFRPVPSEQGELQKPGLEQRDGSESDLAQSSVVDKVPSETVLAQAPEVGAEPQGIRVEVTTPPAVQKPVKPQEAAKILMALLETKKPAESAYDLLDGVLATREVATAGDEEAQTGAELKL
jgi:hypothetical protein